MSQGSVAIVGAGHAGGRVAQHLIEAGYSGQVTLIGEEIHHPYERPALSKELLLGSKTVDDLLLAPAPFWTGTPNLQRLHARVVGLDSRAKVLELDSGHPVAFEHLVLATGGAPRRLSIPGGDLPGLHYLRTLDEGHALREALQGARSLAVIGAGVIGMEAAASATRMGLKVMVIEAGARVMARCIPAEVSEWLAGEHRAAGVGLHLGAGVKAIEACGSAYQVHGVADDGTSLVIEADAVLVAVGIVCETDFADRAGILVDNGIVVDAHCRSINTPWCYAVGDVASTLVPALGAHVRQETWRNAENQASAVAEFILGRTEPYHETQWMWTDQFGHNIQVVGVPQPGDVVVPRGDLLTGKATLVHLRDGVVTGGVMINQGRDRKALEALVAQGCAPDIARLADLTVNLKQVAV